MSLAYDSLGSLGSSRQRGVKSDEELQRRLRRIQKSHSLKERENMERKLNMLRSSQSMAGMEMSVMGDDTVFSSKAPFSVSYFGDTTAASTRAPDNGCCAFQFCTDTESVQDPRYHYEDDGDFRSTTTSSRCDKSSFSFNWYDRIDRNRYAGQGRDDYETRRSIEETPSFRTFRLQSSSMEKFFEEEREEPEGIHRVSSLLDKVLGDDNDIENELEPGKGKRLRWLRCLRCVVPSSPRIEYDNEDEDEDELHEDEAVQSEPRKEEPEVIVSSYIPGTTIPTNLVCADSSKSKSLKDFDDISSITSNRFNGKKALVKISHFIPRQGYLPPDNSSTQKAKLEQQH